MALNLSIGSLYGAPTKEDTGSASGDHSAVVSAAAVWKSPVTGMRCRTRKQRNELDLSPSPPMSPCPPSPKSDDWWTGVSPTRPDLSMACRAFDTHVAEMEGAVEGEITEHAPLPGRGEGLTKGYKGVVPVFVMLPLDSVTMNHTVNRKKAMNVSLQALKSAGVEGIMLDVWWGLIENESPGKYNWDGYTELFEMARKHGLKIQAVMSFHRCGGNVGDSCTIPLPKWVVEEIERDPDLAYTDQSGRRNYEYVSLGCDQLPVLKGRTPVQCYADFMRAFRDNFNHLLGETIVEIQVGMGPAGELRYPSYPEQNGTWRFPGIGAFQCYDKYMLNSLKAAAENEGKPKWGHGGPSDAGQYNNWPEDTPFFRREGGWTSEYGQFFLGWYSQMLIDHGERIVSSAEAIFKESPTKISVKIAGIHWHFGTRSHAPELTAGYYNTRFRDGYLPIARMLARHGAVFNFTCIEMKDYEQPQDALCAPEKLVKQVVVATKAANVALAGENALPRYDEGAHQQIITAAKTLREDSMCAFTYLRMGPDLFQADNWRRFVAFVKKMNEGKDDNRCREQVERDAEIFVHIPTPRVEEPAVVA